MQSTFEAKEKWDSYFDEVPPKQWRYLDFYQTRSLRPEFSRSFAKESSVLSMHHQDLIAVTSRWTLVDAVGGSARGGELFAWELGLKFSVTPHKLYGRQAACCLSDGLRALVCEGEGELPRTTRDGKSRAAVLKDCNHRKKYDEVDLFWIAIEEEEAVRTKVGSCKSKDAASNTLF
ncbi:hypothetical protein BC936DRAFT_136924 [Jimgerdemannia flammicorona]|uniref:Uncharacterized protein n=1 Tax=Jimgerdemannia flammicorona TaxID=994334 RepID=A0A433CYH3_9FUNG|nr:hypothetical protein BC936DRAFT_136924 [Jimgerdemannia flammicorona]